MEIFNVCTVAVLIFCIILLISDSPPTLTSFAAILFFTNLLTIIIAHFIKKDHDKKSIKSIVLHTRLREFSQEMLEEEYKRFSFLKYHLKLENFEVLNYIDNGLSDSQRELLFINKSRTKFGYLRNGNSFITFPADSVRTFIYDEIIYNNHSPNDSVLLFNIFPIIASFISNFHIRSSKSAQLENMYFMKVFLNHSNVMSQIFIPLVQEPKKLSYSDVIKITKNAEQIKIFLKRYSRNKSVNYV